jgi:hypothetical protein
MDQAVGPICRQNCSAALNMLHQAHLIMENKMGFVNLVCVNRTFVINLVHRELFCGIKHATPSSFDYGK